MKYIREAIVDLNLQKYICPSDSKIDSILSKYLHDLDDALKDAPRDWLRSETDTIVTFIHFQDSPSSTDLVFRCLNGCHDGPINYNFAGAMEKDGKYFVFTHGVAGHLKLTTDTINIHFRYTEYKQEDNGWRNGWKNGIGYYTKTYRYY